MSRRAATSEASTPFSAAERCRGCQWPVSSPAEVRRSSRSRASSVDSTSGRRGAEGVSMVEASGVGASDAGVSDAGTSDACVAEAGHSEAGTWLMV